MFPQTDHCIEISFHDNGHSRSISRNSFKKKVAIGGGGGCVLFVVIVLVLVCVFTFRKDNSVKVQQNFQTLYDVTTAVMNKTMNVYCSHLPLLFTENCDQFTTRFLARMDSPLPQLALRHQFNINDQKTHIEFLVNMTTTVDKYIILIDQVMKQEHIILCHSFMVAGIKCNFPEICGEQKKDSNAVFYCGLHLTHNYLTQLKMFLEKAISDLPPPDTLMDDVPDFLKELPSIFRRWYTMAILKEAIKQVETFRNVLEISRA